MHAVQSSQMLEAFSSDACSCMHCTDYINKVASAVLITPECGRGLRALLQRCRPAALLLSGGGVCAAGQAGDGSDLLQAFAVSLRMQVGLAVSAPDWLR